MELELHAVHVAAALGATAVVAVSALVAALSRKGRSEDEARAYLAGVNYVLSGDPDAAIAELSKAARLNSETLETYFALGALFRRKGELDRALRLHQNILLRSGLAREVRQRAQLAVALDYSASGLSDKAAEELEKLLAEVPEHREALVRYRRILEDGCRWERALELQARLVELEGRGGDVLAHLLAALARARLAEDPAEAEALAARAVGIAPRSADAQLAWAEVLLGRGRAAEAVAPLRAAVELEPELAPRCLGALSAALGAEALEAFLEERIVAAGEAGAPCALALALQRRARGQVDLAIVGLKRLVERQPRFWEARKELGALLLSQDRSEELRADYEEILGTLGQPAMNFACEACGQRLPEHVFRCPACGDWDGVRREQAATGKPLI